jgi:16S rRNA (cytosine967-C5)-methyltransferase
VRSMPSPISPARKAAFDLLLDLKQKPELHSDALLHAKRMDVLSSLDKNLATTLVMGVLRWQLVLQERIRASLSRSKSHLGDPVQTALELGALQLLALDRIPAHAAIFESVELVRQSGNDYAVGLVNAVLRKLTQSPKLTNTDAPAAHPDWMVARWTAIYGKQSASAICAYDQQPPSTTIRFSAGEAPAGLQWEPGTFVERAYRVISGDVTQVKGLRMQDEGSQLIAELAGHGTNILDCCAAPGGKAAILAERNPQAQITACDVSPRRLKAMQSLLKQPQIRYRVLDATALPFDQQFDLVLCDAPCSGTGTLARNPEIRHRLTVEEFSRQHDRQVRLLQSSMRALASGGRLIYSTCSLETEENEAVVTEALKGQKDFRLLPWKKQIRDLEAEGTLRPGTADRLFPDNAADEFLRTLPGNFPIDGFFAACLTRS